VTLTSWRKPALLTPRFKGDGLSTVFRKAASGWTWKLLCESEQIASGHAPTQRQAVEAVRLVKAKRLGKPVPEPLAPRRTTRVEAKP